MSFWSRIANTFRSRRLNDDLDDELASHLEEAIEHGRDPGEARKALGSTLRLREASRDVRLLPWLESFAADVVFGWRQLSKNRITSAAAILSLALAIGACTSAFRIVDALLLRPLPVTEPDQLHYLFHSSTAADGRPGVTDTFEFPLFRQMGDSVKDGAELIAITSPRKRDLTYASDGEMERTYVQYVSGWMFESFGLHPVAGRLLTEQDDRQPLAHPFAVLSNDYWTGRFGRDPAVIGRTFRMEDQIYTIVGVCFGPFNGTDPGTLTDIFVPTMMSPNATTRAGWVRIYARLKPGASPESILHRLRPTFRAYREEQARNMTGMNRENVAGLLRETLRMEGAASGVSVAQREYRRSLIVISVLVGLVLLIACANVANLMTAQAAARSREMALRVSIGAGRWRLVQMLLVESATVALLASALGAAFAWYAAPFVVEAASFYGNPMRLILPIDWRLLGFGLLLSLAVTCLFGLAPALRASAIKPAIALRGGEDPHSRRRVMTALIGVQAAFCVLVLFVAGLFVATFDRLAKQPTGFSADRVLTLEMIAGRPLQPTAWDQLAEHVRTVPGIESVALAGWPLLSGTRAIWSISINGEPPRPDRAYFLNVSPGWFDAMKVLLIDGRDFRSDDVYPRVAIVNESFSKWYLNGENPLGRFFEQAEGRSGRVRLQIVGVVRDARYEDLRGVPLPVVYVPFHLMNAQGRFEARRSGSIVVRTSARDPISVAAIVRHEVVRAHPEFRISEMRPQSEIVEGHTARERLLAMLGLFFAVVALLLGGVGLYGVLSYSVVQRRREIGILMAIGAGARDVVRRVAFDAFAVVCAGALIGLGLGLATARYLETLLYGVNAADVEMLAVPGVVILVVACIAALPAIIHAVQLDPVTTLRVE
jgi:predicted permease